MHEVHRWLVHKVHRGGGRGLYEAYRNGGNGARDWQCEGRVRVEEDAHD